MSCKCKNIIENFQGGSIPLLTTIGSQSACTSATTTVLIVSGKTNFGCDINVLNGGGIFSGGTNILDLFSSGSGSNYFTTGGTYNTGSGVLSLFLNDGNNFNVSGFTTSSGGGTFTVEGDNGTPFTIVSGDTLQFVGQTGLNVGVSDPEVRIAMDYSGPDSFIMAAANGTSITVDDANDKLVIYDDDAAVVKYINVNQLPSGGGTFTGNTSATCINQLWVSNISGCSPVTIGTEVEVKNNLNSSGVISSDTIGLSKSWLSSPPYIELFSHDPMTKSLYFNKNTILEKVFMGDPTNYDPDSLFTIYSNVAVKSGMTVSGNVTVGDGTSGDLNVTGGTLTVTSSGTNSSDTVFLVQDSAGNHIIEGLDTGQVHVGDLINSALPTNPTLMIGAGKAPNDRGSLAFTSTGIGVGGDNDATGDYLHFLLPGSDNSRWKFDTSSAFGFTLVSRQNNTFGSGSGTRSSFYTSRTYGVDFLLGYANTLGVTDTVGYRFNTKDSTSAGANDVERFVIENGESKTKSYFDNISVLGVGTPNPSTATTLHVSGDTLVSGGFTASTMTLNNVPAFADDGAAATGGLSVGDVYQTSGAGAAPLNTAGILMIKQ